MQHGQIIRLAVHRHGGWTLPDNIHGYYLLKALVITGATESEVYAWAPWLTPQQLRTLLTELNAVPLSYWTPERLGTLVELLDSERELLKLWLLRPCDIEWYIVQARSRTRAKVRNRKQMRERRKLPTMAKTLDVRTEAVLALLDNKWRSASQLAANIEGGSAWCKSDGQPLAGASLRVTLHRALDELLACSLIESRTERDRQGQPLRRVRRLSAPFRLITA
jgi:hypothetical protein